MTYKIIEHTADVRLYIEAADMAALFSEALRGMMEIADPEEEPRATESSRIVNINSIDRTALLIDFLNEVIFLSGRHREFYTKVVFREIGDGRLSAELIGTAVSGFGKDIKAVTYHEALIKRNERGELETMIVLDI